MKPMFFCGTCGEQVVNGLGVLQHPKAEHPQLQSVAVPICSFGIQVKLLQTAHTIVILMEGLLLPIQLIQIICVRFRHVPHPCGNIKQVVRGGTVENTSGVGQ